MSDSAGETAEAGPSIAVQMVGLNAVPVAGDEFTVCETEQQVSRAPRRADCASQEHAPQPEPTTVLVISCRPCRACAYITASGPAGQGGDHASGSKLSALHSRSYTVCRCGDTRCSAAQRARPARRAQARRQAQAIESSLRLERLSQQAGGSMVTTKSLASMDEEGVEAEGVLQRLNIILKARAAAAGLSPTHHRTPCQQSAMPSCTGHVRSVLAAV